MLNVDPSDTLLAAFRQSEAREGIEYIYRTSRVEHAWEQHDGMLALDLKVRVAQAPSG